MSFHFRDAKREDTRLLIGLAGSSGSGKTFSALRLATGLSGGGLICVVDTEGKRASMYANDFKFQTTDFPKPFSPERYVQALDAASKLQPAVVIIDSVSHVWEGPGGVLEMVEEQRKVVKNDLAIWAKPKAAHQKFVNAFLQVPCHVILCYRAKEKSTLAKDDRGKNVVVSLGWQPIADSSLTYEMTINCLMSAENKGHVIIKGYDHGKVPEPLAHIFKDGCLITEDLGRKLRAWCNDNEASPAPEQEEEIPRFTSANAMMKAIKTCPDTAQLALIDKAFQRDLPEMAEDVAEKLSGAIMDRVQELTSKGNGS